MKRSRTSNDLEEEYLAGRFKEIMTDKKLKEQCNEHTKRVNEQKTTVSKIIEHGQLSKIAESKLSFAERVKKEQGELKR